MQLQVNQSASYARQLLYHGDTFLTLEIHRVYIKNNNDKAAFILEEKINSLTPVINDFSQGPFQEKVLFLSFLHQLGTTYTLFPSTRAYKRGKTKNNSVSLLRELLILLKHYLICKSLSLHAYFQGNITMYSSSPCLLIHSLQKLVIFSKCKCDLVTHPHMILILSFLKPYKVSIIFP